MLYDDQNAEEYIAFHQLLSGLLSSIRDLNRRIDELKWIVKETLYSEDSRWTVVKKVERLNETRMCLIYSVFDLRKRAEKQINTSLDITKLYKELKDL